MKAYPEIRRYITEVGMIRVSVRTHDKGLLSRMRHAVEDLRLKGRFDWLILLRDGGITPLALLDRIQETPIKKLPPAEVRLFTEDTIARTLNGLAASPRHQRDTGQDLRRLLRLAPAGASLAVLPGLVQDAKTRYMDREQYRAFNKLRSSVLTLLRETVRRRSPIYQDVLEIDVLDTERRREGNPQTPREAFELAAKMGAVWGAAWMAMCVTGMGPKELWGAWEIEGDRITIHGTKRKSRQRIVFRLADITRPPLTYDAGYRHLRAILKAASERTVQPYDARRTFAHWCELAGVPLSRIDHYLGHGAKKMLDLYTRHDVGKYLVEDRETVRRYLAANLPKQPKLDAEKSAESSRKGRGSVARLRGEIPPSAPPWNRTKNLLIKSQLLCQLS